MHKTDDASGRDLLREFWISSGELSDMQFSMVSRLLQPIPGEDFLVYRAKDADGNGMLAPGEEDDYRGARPGDHLVPFTSKIPRITRTHP
jgi:hypothetical protein